MAAPPSSDPPRRLHLRIHGRVQGVGYRAALIAQAQALGLRGWVRNRADGSVEAQAAGTASACAALLRWAWQGPPAARVERVDASETAWPADGGDAEPLPAGFIQRPTC